ncbi:hypothetical protein P3S67_014834 [Capsicum chacoense]
MKTISERSQKAQSEGSQLASEAVINHRTITAFSSQDRMLDLFSETPKGPRIENTRHSLLSGAVLFCSQFLATPAIALTYWYVGRLMNRNLLTSKHLFQVFFLLMSTEKNITDTGSITSDLARGSSVVASAFSTLDGKTEIEPESPEGLKVTKVSRRKIELKSVFFYYPSRPDQAIFQGMNLKIESGKTVALVRRSGSGKSTIIILIERFCDPIKGQVQIDDRDIIKSYNLKSLRSQIALVSQEPALFAGSIHENISYRKE